MKILIDNGHGINTPGKCSPDRTLREWKYTRTIATEVVNALRSRGYDAERIVTEEADISLAERARRANAWCSRLGTSNVILISIHCNAAGADDRWHSATGWSAFVCPGASRRSLLLAEALHDAADAQGLKTLHPKPRQKYWVKNLAMCRKPLCPAVLTENLFQDNRADVTYLLSDTGRKSIVNLHVNAIISFLKAIKQ